MAPPSRVPPPPVQLRGMLLKRRERGMPFDEAWLQAYKRITWPHDTAHRRQWKSAILATKRAWGAAYYSSPAWSAAHNARAAYEVETSVMSPELAERLAATFQTLDLAA